MCWVLFGHSSTSILSVLIWPAELTWKRKSFCERVLNLQCVHTAFAVIASMPKGIRGTAFLHYRVIKGIQYLLT